MALLCYSINDLFLTWDCMGIHLLQQANKIFAICTESHEPQRDVTCSHNRYLVSRPRKPIMESYSILLQLFLFLIFFASSISALCSDLKNIHSCRLVYEKRSERLNCQVSSSVSGSGSSYRFSGTLSSCSGGSRPFSRYTLSPLDFVPI